MDLYRGYGAQTGYLCGFPTTGVRWERAALTPDEVLSVSYIDWSYWLELSGGTRSPRRAAERIRDGHTPYGVSNDGFATMARMVGHGHLFPELIVASTGEPDARTVCVEGHARLTAYALAADALPPQMDVLLATSPDVAAWWAY